MEKNQKRIEANNIISKVNDEAFEIYKKVMDDKKLPEYYLYELIQKNEYLRSRLSTSIKLINSSLDDEIKEDKTGRAKVFLLVLANALLLITMPHIGIITTPIYILYIFKKLCSEKENNSDELAVESKSSIESINKVIINIDNNEVFLKKKIKELTKERIEEVEYNREKVQKILEANILIQDYLNYGKLPKSAKEDVKRTAINMLRQDLNSNETDLETLLNLAKKQLSLDTLVRKMEFDEK